MLGGSCRVNARETRRGAPESNADRGVHDLRRESDAGWRAHSRQMLGISYDVYGLASVNYWFMDLNDEYVFYDMNMMLLATHVHDRRRGR